MDSLPGAASLVRGLLVLARSGQSGILEVRVAARLARLGVREGRVVALRIEPDDGDALGDALRSAGDWNEAVARGSSPRPGEPMGSWAVRVGAVSPQALSLALRRQLQRRLSRLLALGPPELRFAPGPWDVGWPAIDEAPTTEALVMGALRERVADLPLWLVRRRLGDGMLVLTPLGQELLEGAVLWPDEQALRPLLKQGASIDALIAVSRGSPRAQRALHAWKVVGACAAPSPRRGYATLLRKTRQLRRRARGAELLDLPVNARPEAARRALRRLARSVHPDRFDGASPAIRAVSHEVMSALVNAQNELGPRR
ncbi:MAG: DUF4388 domain-containing protein [Sandaracinaceae bacterium]